MSTVTMTSGRRTVREALLASLRDAAAHNSMDVVAPRAVLWPDEGRHWSTVVEELGGSAPILKLGAYAPESETGPAPWLRLRLRELLGQDEPDEVVIYLPGVSRRTLTDAQALDAELQPIAGLVVRSTIFSQQNSTDWTPYAYLTNQTKGLGADVANDAETRDALGGSLVAVLDIPLDELRRRRWGANDFHGLVVQDPVRSLLKWMDNPEAYEKSARAAGTWDGFAQLVKSTWKLSLEGDGPLAAGAALGSQAGKWGDVWLRFLESPGGYPGIGDLLRRSRPETLPDPLVWPQDNDEAELEVGTTLRRLRENPKRSVCEAVGHLEQVHGPRRESVWGRLGESPLAGVVGLLDHLADLTSRQLAGLSVGEMAASYAGSGWQVDDTFIRVLAALPAGHASQADVSWVATALYRPWLQATTSAFQAAWLADPRWVGPEAGVARDAPAGTCAMFVDGLRMDVAARVAARLSDQGFSSDLGWGKAGMPTVTSTCKPALTPLAGDLKSADELNPTFPEGQPWTQDGFKRRLPEAGWDFVAQDQTGDPTGRGWTEGGDIDKLGHEVGVKLVNHLDSEASAIANRVIDLLASGWQKVIVVTDHGWLLLPDKLPKHPLAEHLTVKRKGRCARMKSGVALPEGVGGVSWTFDDDVIIGVAPSIYAFEEGKVYEHGGLSPQESIVPRLVVMNSGGDATVSSLRVDFVWTGLRLKVDVAGAPDGSLIDIRTKPGDPSSSLASKTVTLKDGKGSLLVADEHEGVAAVVVVLGPDGSPLHNKPTQVPEG